MEQESRTLFIKAAALIAVATFLYASVLSKLAIDWWSDENYSHGLLVPFVIGYILWREKSALRSAFTRGSLPLGAILIAASMLLLLAGTLAAELFTQRISLLILIGGLTVYFLGTQILKLLSLPLALLLLAIPIPQIIFNKIAIPLQTYASQLAVWGIRLFDVPTVRKGNVIDILPKGATQVISLEVVEACSGIRSLMTLVTLALILGYFTRRPDGRRMGLFSTMDVLRTVALMLAAVPIAVVTNAARVTATGVMTYTYGKQATDSTVHDISGWLVYVAALGLLLAANFVLGKIFSRTGENMRQRPVSATGEGYLHRATPVIITLLICGLFINWVAVRSEVPADRRPLAELSATLGNWRQMGSDIHFDPGVEAVLRASDYTMREYTDPTGKVANIYVGYYATQRTGATYHSPQNCLPGAGWQLTAPETIDIPSASGRTFKANLYIIENGIYREAMIYWYQGRGRTEASEYRDKLNTALDSVIRRRTDGSMVRVMTSVGEDRPAAIAAAVELSSKLADELTPFIPE